MALLAYNTTPAERARGCVFAENFETSWHVEENGAAVSGAPSFNFAGAFDGANDYLHYPDFTAYNFVAEPFSLMCWFTPSSGLGASKCRLVDKSQAGTGNGWGWDISVDSMRMLGATNRTFTFASDIVAGTWYHLAITSTGAGNASGYIDGALISSGAYTHTNVWTGTLNIAAASNNTALLPGSLRQVRIFDVALTADEVADYYNGGNVP
jgi:hypothetical protein